MGDLQYTYKLPSATRHLLEQVATDPCLPRFQSLATKLLHQSIWPLELGSTILFFYRQTHDWNDALTKACQFKKVSPNDESSASALALAQYVSEQSEGNE